MSGSKETPLEMAERHVREGEDRVARQRAVIETMERDQHPERAARGRAILTVMEETLQLARQHVELERQKKAFAETKKRWNEPT